jgi:hypothetical protein
VLGNRGTSICIHISMLLCVLAPHVLRVRVTNHRFDVKIFSVSVIVHFRRYFLFSSTRSLPDQNMTTICTSTVTLVFQAPRLSCIKHLCTSVFTNNKINHLKYGISICCTENQRKAREISSKRFPYKRFEFKVSYEENYEIYFKKVSSRCARERSQREH